MKPVIHLDLREMLPVIRKAYDTKQLQMFTSMGEPPKYTGPCAIGVCLPEDIRTDLDSRKYSKFYSIPWLFYESIFTTENENMKKDIIKIQNEHDGAGAHPEQILKFGKLLCELEKKYLREGAES